MDEGINNGLPADTNMENAQPLAPPAHPGLALATQLGITPELGVQAWNRVREGFQADLAAERARATAQQQAAIQAAVQAAVQAALQQQAAVVPAAAPIGAGNQLPKKKESPWPKWDGTAGTFMNYHSQLRVKIEEDRHLLGSDRAICYGMLQSLPATQQARAHGWFNKGGPEGDYNWEVFLTEFATLFEDKQAKQNAGEQLTRMRQGNNQFFTDFLQDFEYKLQQCGGSEWACSAKIMQLNASINTPLRTALVTVDLPDDNYDHWKTKVTAVAGRLEGLSGYRPKGATHTKTWYTGTSGGGRVAQSTVDQGQTHRVDADGDTFMGGVNALATAMISAMKGNPTAVNAFQPPRSEGGSSSGSGDHRPRAPWKSPDVIRRLMGQGVCIRCERSGHFGRNCPTFKGARRPGTRVSAAATAATSRTTAAVTAAPQVGEVDSDDSESKNGSP